MSKRKILLFTAALGVFLVATLLASNRSQQVCFGDNCFSVEVARTNQQRLRGLMDREYLGEHKGMLFVFQEDDTYGFWMKNTRIPLDIIWLDHDKRVVFIKNSAQPCQGNVCTPIFPDHRCRYVLEVNAGMAARLGLRVGDTALFTTDD